MKRVLSTVAGAVAMLLTLSTATQAQTPGTGTEPSLVSASAVGAPSISSTSPYGYYLWIDGDTIHLRTTDPGGHASIYTGSVVTDGVIRDVSLIRPESDDYATASGGTLDFRFRTGDGIDGVSFTARGADRMVFRLYRDGHLIRTDHIFIGAGGLYPPGNPFALFV